MRGTKLLQRSHRSEILFIVPYPTGQAASQRFRFEQYSTILLSNNFDVRVEPFLNSQNWKLFFNSGNTWEKLRILLLGFARRCLMLFSVRHVRFVFIHREAAPVGPPFFEWILRHILRKKIIYDFDDAIWMSERQNESLILRILKWRRKVGSICKWAHVVSCGNEYLCEYARQFNSSVVLNPTTIDTEGMHVPSPTLKDSNKVVIGWTGSHSTLKYIEAMEPVLRAVASEYPTVHYVIVADKKPVFTNLPIEFQPWSKSNEIEILNRFDIGIMPLKDDPWSRGKCGFKALQYMSLSIPTVLSPVGVNVQIVNPGVNGFFANSDEEWIRCLEILITDIHTRERMGKAARETVVQSYSVISNASTFLSLFA